jgi:hypothetical protein
VHIRLYSLCFLMPRLLLFLRKFDATASTFLNSMRKNRNVTIFINQSFMSHLLKSFYFLRVENQSSVSSLLLVKEVCDDS